MTGHTLGFLAPLFDLPHIGKWVSACVTFVQPFGQLGVELFFVLSGFLIGGILIDTFLSTAFTGRDVLHFWVRRWFRTLPVYWLILTTDSILYIFLKLQSHETHRFFYYIFIQNLWYPHPRFFFGEAWSLSIEEWFYLTLPLVLLLAAARRPLRNKKKLLAVVFTSYLAVFAAARFANAFHPINGPDIDFGIRKVVIFRLDAVMYGVLFAWLKKFAAEAVSRWRKALLLLSLGGATLVYFLLTDSGVAFCNASPARSFLTNAFLYMAIPFFFALSLPFANGVTRMWRPAALFFRYISKISYSMYLVHYSLIFIPFFSFLRLTSHKETVLLYLLYWAVMLCLSTLLYRYFEAPVMRLRDRFGKRHTGR